MGICEKKKSYKYSSWYKKCFLLDITASSHEIEKRRKFPDSGWFLLSR